MKEKLDRLVAACKGAVHLEYRGASSNYKSLAEAIDEGDYYGKSQFLSPEDSAKCVATDKYWTLHFYPLTPVGFHSAHASDVEMLLDWALEVISE